MANIIFIGEMLKDFPLKVGIRQKRPLLFLFNMVLDLLANEEKQDMEIKDKLIGKNNITLSLLIDGITVYVKYPKEPINTERQRTKNSNALFLN